jgi:hypothetical protein
MKRRGGRAVKTAIGAVAVALALAGCGAGEDSSAQVVSVRGDEYAFVLPNRIEGGMVTMEFTNTGRELHDFSLSRLEPGVTLADVKRELSDGSNEEPKGLVDVGGLGVLSPGERISIGRSLEPGRYVFLCLLPAPDGRSHLEHGMVGAFTVAGRSEAEPPATDGTISATDKGFEIPAIESGRRTLELRNAASDGRGFELWRFAPGKKLADVEAWGESGFKDPAPATFLGAMQTIPPGTSVFLTVDLEAGQAYTVLDDETGNRAEFTPR